MIERPILFSGPMVRAILEGRKTQTRRVVKPQPKDREGGISPICYEGDRWEFLDLEAAEQSVRNLYGKPGDRLWVRETFSTLDCHHGQTVYRAGGEKNLTDMKWKPSIFMRRKHSRITLEIVSVRVERLQDISYRDCEAEGLMHVHRGWWVNPYAEDPQATGADEGFLCYRNLWESINGKGSWKTNPWVWVIEFKRL